MVYNRGVHENSSRGCASTHPGLGNCVGGAITMSHSIPVSPDLKVCTHCGQAKPLTEYHKMRDGLRPTCKLCTNAQNRSIYEKNKPAHLSAKRTYRSRNPEVRAATVRKYDTTHAAMRTAHWTVRDALASGTLQPPTQLKCAQCGGKAAVYHHESYAPEDRLNVTPLCRACHGEMHRRY